MNNHSMMLYIALCLFMLSLHFVSP